MAKRRNCPSCGVVIKKDRKKCPHCDYYIHKGTVPMPEFDQEVLRVLLKCLSYAETGRRLAVSRQRIHTITKKYRLTKEITELRRNKRYKKTGKKIVNKLKTCYQCKRPYSYIRGVSGFKFCSDKCRDLVRRAKQSRYNKAYHTRKKAT